MNFNNIVVGCLLILSIINFCVINEFGKTLREVKYDTQCTKTNVWYTQDLLLREKK